MYFTPSAVKRQNFLRREKRLPPAPPPWPPPPRRSSPPPPRSPPPLRPPPPSLLKAIAVYPRALRRLLRPGCPHHPKQRQLHRADVAAAEHRRRRPHHPANGRDAVHHPLHRRLSPSARARSPRSPY